MFFQNISDNKRAYLLTLKTVKPKITFLYKILYSSKYINKFDTPYFYEANLNFALTNTIVICFHEIILLLYIANNN